MADNYLENKMEALRQGPRVVRRPSVSVEGLLKRLGEPPQESPQAVMAAQTAAVARGAQQLPEARSLRFEFSDESIRILGPDAQPGSLVELGQVLMAMRLKAAEMHLHSEVILPDGSAGDGEALLATLRIWK